MALRPKSGDLAPHHRYHKKSCPASRAGLPGGALYYTMNAIISEDMVRMIQKAKETGMMVLGIVLGILIASEIVRVLQWLYFHRDKFVRRRTLPLPPSKKQ